MTQPMPIAATDTETTGRNPTRHMAWEVAVIFRDLDGTETRRLWQLRPTAADLLGAEPKALQMNRYWERFAVPAGAQAADMTPTLTGGTPRALTYAAAAAEIWATLNNTVLLGSNAHFDADFLHALFDRHLPRDQTVLDPWHYRPVCAVTLAVGYLHAQGWPLEIPYSTTDVTEAMGVPRPRLEEAHTAFGDAAWLMRLFDALSVRGGR